MKRATLLVASLAGLAGQACSQVRAITEAELLSYASTPYEVGEQKARREVLGALDGVNVVVDFICSDLCPANTVRVIHFDVEPGPPCARVGGVERPVLVPAAISATTQVFCLPKVLAAWRVDAGRAQR